MKHATPDTPQVQTAMKETVWYRRHFIQPGSEDKDKPDVGQVIEMFPRLFDTDMVGIV